MAFKLYKKNHQPCMTLKSLTTSTVGYFSDSWAFCYFLFTLSPRQAGSQGSGSFRWVIWLGV